MENNSIQSTMINIQKSNSTQCIIWLTLDICFEQSKVCFTWPWLLFILFTGCPVNLCLNWDRIIGKFNKQSVILVISRYWYMLLGYHMSKIGNIIPTQGGVQNKSLLQKSLIWIISHLFKEIVSSKDVILTFGALS